jgi:lactate dehydrogenase-like 2-hydroxyacid dehydrogenase
LANISATTRPIRPVPITATFKSLMDFDKSYSPNSIAEFAVTQAINVVRHFNQIQTKVREHDFRWEPTILSKSIKDLKVAVIGIFNGFR